MTVSQMIRPGDKIDIRLIQQIESAEKDGGTPKVYKSQVLDILENGNLEIAMPSEGGRLILLPLGARFEFVFYAMGGLYRSVGRIKERYKKENVYMLEIELKSQLEKFQRREFYRYSCIMDIKYYNLTEKEAAADSVEKIFSEMLKYDLMDRENVGKIVDLSGGGTRFRTGKELMSGEYLLLGVQLKNDRIDKQYYIVGNVIDCYRMENVQDKIYEVRVKFLIRDDKVREEIIRYIFEEERRTRQKEKG